MMSCIVSVMNRTPQLEQMLPSWTQVKEINDFVIVDWSSDIPIIENYIVQQQMEKYKNIKIIRVEGEEHFYRCLTWNLASKYIKNKIILKLDADSINVDASWIQYLKFHNSALDRYYLIGMNFFYRDSSGFLLVNKEDFEAVNGYNENLLPTWGGDDIDLNLRLDDYLSKKYSLDQYGIFEFKNSRRLIFFDIKRYIYNIRHSDKERISYLQGKYPLEEGDIRDKMHDYSNVNKDIAIKQKEWKHKTYNIISESDNYIKLERLKTSEKLERKRLE